MGLGVPVYLSDFIGKLVNCIPLVIFRPWYYYSVLLQSRSSFIATIYRPLSNVTLWALWLKNGKAR